MGLLKRFPPRREGKVVSNVKLTSWKEIAVYLDRSPRTVQRWEAEEDLPVHRIHHTRGDSVFALTDELDSWVEHRQRQPQDGNCVPPLSGTSGDEEIHPKSYRGLAAVAIACAVVALAIGGWTVKRYSRVQWALQEAVPEIRRLTEAGDFWSAYRLAQRAQQYIPDHPDIAQVTTGALAHYSINTDPQGAEVYVKSYGVPDAEWDLLGVTPMEQIPVKLRLLRWRFAKEGFDEVQGGFDVVFTPEITVPLSRAGSGPPGMVFVPKGGWGSRSRQQVEDYWIDRYEVTNRQYQEFVLAGGYTEQRYWKYPFMRDGREMSWAEAMEYFVGQNGRPGPATWKLGTYPEGQDNHPVSGVSWYEAAAYAEFAGKSLPTNTHWQKAAGLGLYSDILSFSNLNGLGTWEVGSGSGIGPYGTYDMAGNVREWCWNRVGNRRYIRGGAWNEPVYMFRQTDAQPPFERLETYGFRCVKYRSRPEPELLAPVNPASSSATLLGRWAQFGLKGL